MPLAEEIIFWWASRSSKRKRMHEMMKQQCELEDQLVTAGISECKKAVIKRC
jgi:hypothetical protein